MQLFLSFVNNMAAILRLTLARVPHFVNFPSGKGEGGVGAIPSRVWPLIELATRNKNERVGRHETKRLVPNFKVLGQPVTCDVTKRSIFGHLVFCRLHLN